MESAFKALGLGTPFYIATIAVTLFTWLDKHASTDANTAIAEWLRGESYRQIDLSRAIIAAFDRLYTRPLFSVTALLRSGSISTISYLIFSVHHIVKLAFNADNWRDSSAFIIGPLVVTIISDYISLFVVRRRLSYAGTRPMLSFFMTIVAAILIVAFTYTATFVCAVFLAGETFLLIPLVDSRTSPPTFL